MTLHPPNANHLVFPVEVIERQPGHFALAESVRGKEQQRGDAPNIHRAIGREACQDRFHVGPRRARRRRFQAVEPWSGDGGGNARATVPRAFGVAKERAERLDRHAHRPSAPRRAALGGQEVVHVLNPDIREGASLRPIPGQKRLRLPAVRSDRRGCQSPLVAHVRGEAVEKTVVGRRRDWGRRRQAPQPLQPLHCPIPKIAHGERGGCAAAASTVIRGPTPCGGLDDRHVQRIPTRKIEMSRDHDELAGDGVERVARVPEVFQMAEELTSFFWEGTRMLACQRDRAGEQFFKHGRTPLLGNPPILRPYLCGLGRLTLQRESTISAPVTT